VSDGPQGPLRPGGASAARTRTRFVKVPLHAAFDHPDLPRHIPAGTVLDVVVTEVGMPGPDGMRWRLKSREAAVPDAYLPPGKPAMRIRI
jgi:hypothetical protein